MKTLSRRDALKRGGAAAAAVTLPVAAQANHADDEPLVALFDEWCRLTDELDGLNDRAQAIDETLPPWAKGPLPMVSEKDIDGAAKAVNAYRWPDCSYRQEVFGMLPKTIIEGIREGLSEAAREASETFRVRALEQLEKHQAARDAVRRSSGLTEVEQRRYAIGERISHVEQRILDTPAATSAGIAAKLRVSIWHGYSVEDEPFADLDWDQKFLITALHDADRLARKVRS